MWGKVILVRVRKGAPASLRPRLDKDLDVISSVASPTI